MKTEELNNRTRKAWWAVTDDGVRKVVGYSCAPNNPDSWWCPEIGFTMQEKHHLFETEQEAIRKRMRDIDVEIDSLTNKRDALIGRLSKLSE